MSNKAQDTTCKCGAPLSEHSIDGQYDGGCLQTKCPFFREVETKVEKQAKRRREDRAIVAKREHADLVTRLDEVSAQCAAWRELAQARGRLLTAQRNEEYSKAILIRGRDVPPIVEKLRKLGVPEEQLR